MNKNRLIKIILFAIIPLILLIFWLTASTILNSKISFSILLTKEPSRNLIVEKVDDGSKIIGNFQASDNNLGLVLLGFNVYAKHPGDILTFKIKEEGAKDWQGSDSYRADWLSPNELFPLGFPQYLNSKGNKYHFEIYSPGNKVVPNGQGLFSGYKYSRGELRSNKKLMISFIIRKALLNVESINFFLGSLLYLSPLIIYLLLLVSAPVWKKSGFRTGLISLLLILTLADIFIFKQIFVGLYLILSAAWIFLALKTNFPRKAFFILFLLLLLLWMAGVLLGKNLFEGKLNYWSYFFLCIGVFSTVLEELSG